MPLPLLLQDEPRPEAQAVSFLGLGKRQGRESAVTPGEAPVISALSSASTQEGALSVFCHRQKRAFLVDSGADVSVFPASPAQMRGSPAQSCATTLRAANGTSIQTFGLREVSLSFPGLKLVHNFLLADVRKPILGSDFFREHRLVIDIPGRRLFRASGVHGAPVDVEVRAKPASFTSDLCGLHCSLTRDSVAAIFDDFPSVVSSPVYDASTPKHGVYHTVPTSGPPVFARARRLFGEKLVVAREAVSYTHLTLPTIYSV